MKTSFVFIAALALAAGVGGGVLLERRVLSDRHAEAAAAPAGDRRVLYWWDPMMPGFRSEKPGKSPMGMDMVPVYEGEAAKGAGEAGVVTVPAATVQNLGVRTARAGLVSLAPSIETFGTVGFDESRVSHVHVRARGWIERLQARVEGETVERGQLLLEFFSPELVSAASEYVRELQRGGSGETADISRRKLASLGVSERQIEEIRRTRQIPERIQVLAPRAGAVTMLGVADGMFVEPNLTVMSIGDLDAVWVMAEVVESQGGLVRAGMAAEIRVPSQPARAWTGTVDYVYPDLQRETRTVRLRIRVDNADRALKPNMFASIRIVAPAREGVLAVPREAVIRTGAGARVVLALGEGRFRPVPVKAGLAVGDRIEILDGLAEGDLVVTSAQFLLDSESSLSAGLARLDAPAAASADAGPIWTEATVNEAPSADGMVNLSHPPIPAIGWPAMTMDFAIDPAVPPQALGAGQRVRAGLAKNPDGTFRVVAVEKAAGAGAK